MRNIQKAGHVIPADFRRTTNPSSLADSIRTPGAPDRRRGIGIPDSVTSGAHAGLRAALRATLNSNMCETLNPQIKRRN